MASRTGKRFRKIYFRYMKRTLAPPEGSFTPGDATSDFVQNLAQKHEVAWFTAAEAMYGPGTQAIHMALDDLGRDFEDDLLAELGAMHSVGQDLLSSALFLRDLERALSQVRMSLNDCLKMTHPQRECAEVADTTEDLLTKVDKATEVHGGTPLLTDLRSSAGDEVARLRLRIGAKRHLPVSSFCLAEPLVKEAVDV